jgi:hypothetical protein
VQLPGDKVWQLLAGEVDSSSEGTSEEGQHQQQEEAQEQQKEGSLERSIAGPAGCPNDAATDSSSTLPPAAAEAPDTPARSPGSPGVAPGSLGPPEGLVVEVALDLAGLAVPPHSASLLPGEPDSGC